MIFKSEICDFILMSNYCIDYKYVVCTFKVVSGPKSSENSRSKIPTNKEIDNYLE